MGPEQQQAFETIKSSISTNSCLKILDPNWKHELHTDAQKDDEECKAIIEAIEGKEKTTAVMNDATQCILMNGTLYHGDIRKQAIDGQLQVVIPKKFRLQLAEEIHTGVMGGHYHYNTLLQEASDGMLPYVR